MRGRSIRTQQTSILSPLRTLSPIVQVLQSNQNQQPHNEQVIQLKMEKVLMGFEIQRLNKVLVELEKKHNSSTEILLREIQELKHNQQQAQVSYQLQAKEIEELNQIVNQTREERDNYKSQLARSIQEERNPLRQIQRDDTSTLNAMISQVQNSLRSANNTKYANQTKMMLELVKSHMYAINQLPSLKDDGIQQMQIYLTTIIQDLGSMNKQLTPKKISQPSQNSTAYLNSNEVFKNIWGYIDKIENSNQREPKSIIKQISSLNQLVRLKNEELKALGIKHSTEQLSPTKRMTTRQLQGSSVRILSPARSVSPHRQSPSRNSAQKIYVISPHRISPKTISPIRINSIISPSQQQHMSMNQYNSILQNRGGVRPSIPINPQPSIKLEDILQSGTKSQQRSLEKPKNQDSDTKDNQIIHQKKEALYWKERNQQLQLLLDQALENVKSNVPQLTQTNQFLQEQLQYTDQELAYCKNKYQIDLVNQPQKEETVDEWKNRYQSLINDIQISRGQSNDPQVQLLIKTQQIEDLQAQLAQYNQDSFQKIQAQLKLTQNEVDLWHERYNQLYKNKIEIPKQPEVISLEQWSDNHKKQAEEQFESIPAEQVKDKFIELNQEIFANQNTIRQLKHQNAQQENQLQQDILIQNNQQYTQQELRLDIQRLQNVQRQLQAEKYDQKNQPSQLQQESVYNKSDKCIQVVDQQLGQTQDLQIKLSESLTLIKVYQNQLLTLQNQGSSAPSNQIQMIIDPNMQLQIQQLEHRLINQQNIHHALKDQLIEQHLIIENLLQGKDPNLAVLIKQNSELQNNLRDKQTQLNDQLESNIENQSLIVKLNTQLLDKTEIMQQMEQKITNSQQQQQLEIQSLLDEGAILKKKIQQQIDQIQDLELQIAELESQISKGDQKQIIFDSQFQQKQSDDYEQLEGMQSQKVLADRLKDSMAEAQIWQQRYTGLLNLRSGQRQESIQATQSEVKDLTIQDQLDIEQQENKYLKNEINSLTQQLTEQRPNFQKLIDELQAATKKSSQEAAMWRLKFDELYKQQQATTNNNEDIQQNQDQTGLINELNFWKDKYMEVLTLQSNIDPESLENKLLQQHNLNVQLQDILNQNQIDLPHEQLMYNRNQQDQQLEEQEQQISNITLLLNQAQHELQLTQIQLETKSQALEQGQATIQTQEQKISQMKELEAEIKSLKQNEHNHLSDLQKIKCENEQLEAHQQQFTNILQKLQNEVVQRNQQVDTYQQQIRTINDQKQQSEQQQLEHLQKIDFWKNKYSELFEIYQKDQLLRQSSVTQPLGANMPTQESIQNLRQSEYQIQEQSFTTEIERLQQIILDQQIQINLRDEQLNQNMEQFKQILKQELQQELENMNSLNSQTSDLQQQLIEKDILLNNYSAQMQNLKDSNVRQYPEGEQWKELILKYQKSRQLELLTLRQQLQQLQEQQISPQEIEFYAQRRVYENTINQLREQLSELEDQNIPSTEDQQRISYLEEQVQYLQNKRNELEINIIQLNQTIQQLNRDQENLQQKQSRSRNSTVNEAVNEMRRAREASNQGSPRRMNRVSQRSSQQRVVNKDIRQSNYLSSPRTTNYSNNNKAVVNQIQELDEVKNKYQNALNHITNLETRVLNKLQEGNMIID